MNVISSILRKVIKLILLLMI